jgi:hypothetical protein
MTSYVGYVVPTALAVGHAYAMYTEYVRMVGKDDPLADMPDAWTTPAVASVLYLVSVFAGKAVMSKVAKPFVLKEAMNVYNLYLTLLSAAMFMGIASETIFAGEPIWTLLVDRSARKSKLAFWLWVNMQSKFLEFADTLFMVLRRKFDQISFLHVSHHTVMGPVMWVVCSQAPGGTR